MTVLIALNDSAPAWTAFDYALEHHDPEEIVLVHVLASKDHGEAAGPEHAAQLFDQAAERAYVAPARFQTDVRTGDPVEGLLAAAGAVDADQIVVGTHGREGVSRILLGSVAEALVRQAPVPVTVVR